MNKIRSQDAPKYDSNIDNTDDAVIDSALEILRKRMAAGPVLTSPRLVRDFLSVELGREKDEVFCALYLSNEHRLIEFKRHFYGSISSAVVHTRVIVRTALELNAAAVIFAHNHPSGNPSPSLSDEKLTKRLSDALELIDVKVLDHIVVAASGSASMAEKGLM